jgi:peptidoglycan/LPS O-acetylase OafA/YrhL
MTCLNMPRRLTPIDFLKAVATQLIVLHHLAFYGPLSDTAYGLAPVLFDWLYEYGRLAVQAFLVVGGFLAARSLASRHSPPIERPLLPIWRRYCRLALPLMAALALAIVCAAVASVLLPLPSTPAAPGLAQIMAHLFLLQDLLGFEALSAGVWYVAIDFQLYALMVVLVWLFRHWAALPVAALAIVSLFHFNRLPAWDAWALYFFGAYALGALVWWAGERRRTLPALVLMAAVVGLALLLDFRSRIAVALATAVLLGLTYQRAQFPTFRPLAFLAEISYAVFLVHYPVCLVVNAAFGRAFPADLAAAALGLLLAWGASILAGALFHRHVEQPAADWLARRGGGLAARRDTAG